MAGAVFGVRCLRVAGVLALVLAAGCDERPIENATADAGEAFGGLSADEASRVLARVGDRAITLGDFAATIGRMNEFDRPRYQTKERRRELLNDMIDAELLTQEAIRRGIDKQADVDEATRQILRDAMISRVRSTLPAPAEIGADEVRAYYDANPDQFTEPERRRVSAIVMDDQKKAEKVLKEARSIKTAGEWGALFFKHSANAKKAEGPAAVDLAGDLGIVGPMSDRRGGSSKVPDPVRAAAFGIADVGGIADALVPDGGRFYIVRLSGRTQGHTRTLAEADRSIRVALLQQKAREKEAAFEEELKRKYPVHIDERALSTVTLPAAATNLDTASKASAPWVPPVGAPEIPPTDPDDEPSEPPDLDH